MKPLEVVMAVLGAMIVAAVWVWTSFISSAVAPFGIKLIGTTSVAIVLAALLTVAGAALLDWWEAGGADNPKWNPVSRRIPGAREAIPRSLEDQVWRRDEGRCRWREDGELCGSREHLEFDHIRPVSKGGRNTYSNLQLLCRTHNRRKAAQFQEPQEDPISPAEPADRHLGQLAVGAKSDCS